MYSEPMTEEELYTLRYEANMDRAARDATLGVGHVWTNTRCMAYRTHDPADCVCQ